MTTKQRQRLEDLLAKVEDLLSEAIVAVQKFVDAAESIDKGLAGEADGYLVGHLHNFISNENQPGSIQSLGDRLNDIE